MGVTIVITHESMLLPVGNTVDEAVYLFSLLENQCRVQLLAEAASNGVSGLQKTLISKEDAEFSASTLTYPENVYINVSGVSFFYDLRFLTVFPYSSNPNTTCLLRKPTERS